MNTMKNKYIARLGGRWRAWGGAGGLFWALDGGVGYRYRAIGGRLIIAKYSRMETSGYFYKLCVFFQPCHSAKHINKRCKTTL